MTHLFIVLVALGIVAYIVIAAIYKYRTTPGTSILTAFHDSLTILWARVLALSGSLVALAASGADFFGDPSLSDAIKSAINPIYVPWFVVAIAIITELARRHGMPPKDNP